MQIRQNRKTAQECLTLPRLGAQNYLTPKLFKITPKQLSPSEWNFVSFSIYSIGAFWKKSQVNDSTAAVITKSGGANSC